MEQNRVPNIVTMDEIPPDLKRWVQENNGFKPKKVSYGGNESEVKYVVMFKDDKTDIDLRTLPERFEPRIIKCRQHVDDELLLTEHE